MSKLSFNERQATRNKSAIPSIVKFINSIRESRYMEIFTSEDPGILRRDFKSNSVKFYDLFSSNQVSGRKYCKLGELPHSKKSYYPALLDVEDMKMISLEDRQKIVLFIEDNDFPNLTVDDFLNIQYDEKKDMYSFRYKVTSVYGEIIPRYIAIKFF